MKILVLSHDTDLVTYQMLRDLNGKAEFSVTVAGPESDRKKVPEGIRFMPMREIKSKMTWGAILDVRKIIKNEKFDAIYAVSTSALSTAILASVLLKIKIVGYRGTQAKVRPLDPTYYLALLNPRVDHIVCETPDIEEYLKKYIPEEKLTTKAKPYDVAWVADAVANPVTYAADKLQLTYIGISKGRPHKGLRPLLDAMALMKDEPMHLTVVGEAEPADIAGAPGNVTFTGNRPDAVRYLPGSDIFVLSSTRDASPRVVREAQACGVPCLVSDIPGARDLIIPGKTGLLVEPDNPQAIADAVRALAAEPERRKSMGKAAAEHIKLHFRPVDYVEYFKNTFLNLSNEHQES